MENKSEIDFAAGVLRALTKREKEVQRQKAAAREEISRLVTEELEGTEAEAARVAAILRPDQTKAEAAAVLSRFLFSPRIATTPPWKDDPGWEREAEFGEELQLFSEVL